MDLLMVLLSISALGAIVADEESCVGRCDLGFQRMNKCQCDAPCSFYGSCCRDYHTVCVKNASLFPVDDIDEYDFLANYTDEMYPDTYPSLEPEPTHYLEPTQDPVTSLEPEPTHHWEPTHGPEPSTEPLPTHPVPGDVCLSEKPFNAFTDLKNGSIFAFQGQYFYELDKMGVVAGYPKQILDVWGVQGPIDAAFTRINCEGKTYLFKGMMYWRFDEGILDNGFPKPINANFPGIPTDLDAALAIPASGIRGNERVYFFKGDRYWEYVFEQQPTQEECAGISISIPFQMYTYQMADKWDDSSEHIGSIPKAGASGPFSISQHWHGIPSGVDAAMIGKLRMEPKQKQKERGRGLVWLPRRGPWWARDKHHKKQWPKDQHRKDSSSEEDFANNFRPHHSVYFFVRDKYYRVNLASKRVDNTRPRYPRSITKYWFKCDVE